MKDLIPETNVVIIHVDDIEGMTPELRKCISGKVFETFSLYINGDRLVVEYGNIFRDEQPLQTLNDIFDTTIINNYEKTISKFILKLARECYDNNSLT